MDVTRPYGGANISRASYKLMIINLICKNRITYLYGYASKYLYNDPLMFYNRLLVYYISANKRRIDAIFIIALQHLNSDRHLNRYTLADVTYEKSTTSTFNVLYSIYFVQRIF